MANHENSGNGGPDGTSSPTGDDSIATLMRLAGPRPAVPADVRQRVHDAVRGEWRQAVKRRRMLRYGVPAALAATVVLGIALVSRGPEISISPLATVALVDRGAGTSGNRFSPGDAVYSGDLLATGDGGVALAVSNGLSLRLAAGTTATFDSADLLRLASGRVYADTGTMGSDDLSITVLTEAGSAKDVGTRFAVSYLDGDMSVAVREGQVDVSGDRGVYVAEAGDLLILSPGNDVVAGTISANDPSWDWAVALAPSFNIEDRTLLDFLKWASRETGKELVFESDDVRRKAMGTRLRGSVSGFTPDEAIQSVLPTTDMQYSVDESRIIIGSNTN